jgi:hypothetical protein
MLMMFYVRNLLWLSRCFVDEFMGRKSFTVLIC